MALSAVRVAVDNVLRGLRPTLPIGLEDSVAVWERLRPLVASPLALDVYHDRAKIIVQIHSGGACVLRRELRP